MILNMRFAKYLSTIFIFLIVNGLAICQVQKFDVLSQSMNRLISNIIILPESYGSDSDPFPVVFLLHGHGGNYADWVRAVPELKRYASDNDIVIVCPDGNTYSWYLDSPVKDDYKFGTYINKELVDAVESNFKVRKDSDGRAITGFSMGGHGALYGAFKYPDIWDIAGSISGGVDIRAYPMYWNLQDILGPFMENQKRWGGYAVTEIAKKHADDELQLYIFCGEDDFFLEVNKKLEQKLIQQNIDHIIRIYPGNHDWSFVRKVLFEQLDYFVECFKS